MRTPHDARRRAYPAMPPRGRDSRGQTGKAKSVNSMPSVPARNTSRLLPVRQVTGGSP